MGGSNNWRPEVTFEDSFRNLEKRMLSQERRAHRRAPTTNGNGAGPGGAAGGDLTGTYPNPTIAEGAVTSVKIADGTITAADLAPGVLPAPPVLGYVFNQSSPSATWTVPHPLAFAPNVSVVDSAGSQVEGDVTYTSASLLTLTFTAAFSGVAYLS